MLELFDYIKKLNIKIKFLSTDIFAGEYASAFKGRGLEFEEVREYISGDDVKNIDWNTSARTGKLHTKVFREERELTVILMVDISSSMFFGSKWEFKSDIATEVSALLAYTAIKNNDKVGLILFSDGVQKYIPPKKGRTHIWHIIKSIVQSEKNHQNTNIVDALKFLGNTIKRKSIVFIVSDFISSNDFGNHLKSLKKKFDFVPVVINDPLEKTFMSKYKNIFKFKDSESGKAFNSYLSFSPDYIEKVYNRFKEINIYPIKISTDKPYINEIIKYFRERVR